MILEDEADTMVRAGDQRVESPALAAPNGDNGALDARAPVEPPRYVAEAAGCVRAMMAIELDDHHLDQLFVDPVHKGHGIGTLLLNHAKSKMPGGMWLRTAKSNTPAIKFYQRHGFTHERDDLHPRLRYPVVYYRWTPADGSPCEID